MLHLRKTTLSDYDEIYALWQAVLPRALNDYDDSEEGFAFYLQRNPNTCFVAVDKGRIVGSILAGHDGRRGFVYHLAVDEKSRRQGVGSGLVAQAVHALGQEGIKKVALVVFGDNDEGNRFWQAQGFDARGDLVYRNALTPKGCGGCRQDSATQ